MYAAFAWLKLPARIGTIITLPISPALDVRGAPHEWQGPNRHEAVLLAGDRVLPEDEDSAWTKGGEGGGAGDPEANAERTRESCQLLQGEVQHQSYVRLNLCRGDLGYPAHEVACKISLDDAYMGYPAHE